MSAGSFRSLPNAPIMKKHIPTVIIPTKGMSVCAWRLRKKKKGEVPVTAAMRNPTRRENTDFPME